MDKDYRETIKQRVLNEATFVRLEMKGSADGRAIPWRKIIVRPVLIKEARHLQFSYFDAKKDITKNYRGDEATRKLDEALALLFSTFDLGSTDEDLLVQLNKKGKARMRRTQVSGKERAPDLAHDAPKSLSLPAGKPDPFLRKLGIMNDEGKVYPAMQGKFSQVNEFLKLLAHTGELEKIEQRPLEILDCGSGSSYLSFAAYHYINDVLGIPAKMVGIDVNEELVEKGNTEAVELDTPEVCFRKSAIIDYQPTTPPGIVLALHACDTATDEAIAQGIVWGARLVMCVPCCHHDLQEQMHTPRPFDPVLRHGILKQRMGDILTDSFRALILRVMGYRTDVVQFISTEHTDRNLMIRAVKRTRQDEARFMREYEELKSFWSVTPYLETLLSERAKEQKTLEKQHPHTLTSPSRSFILSNRITLLLTASGLLSQPVKVRASLAAPTSVVPEPQNRSATASLWLDDALIMRSSSASGFCVSYPTRSLCMRATTGKYHQSSGTLPRSKSGTFPKPAFADDANVSMVDLS